MIFFPPCLPFLETKAGLGRAHELGLNGCGKDWNFCGSRGVTSWAERVFWSWEAEEAWEEAASQLEMNSVGGTGC